jgi:hypothetical protein
MRVSHPSFLSSIRGLLAAQADDAARVTLARAGLAALALVLATLALAVPRAQASPQEFGIETGTASLSTLQAGAYPDFSTVIGIKQDPSTEPNLFGLRDAYAIARDIEVSLPPGLIGNTNAVAKCSERELVTESRCPNASQVGITKIYGYQLTGIVTEPIYLMEPPGGDIVARLGLIAGLTPSLIDVRLDPAHHYAVRADAAGIPPRTSIEIAETKIWGIPANPSHDTERMTPTEAVSGVAESPPRPPGGPEIPFMINPTSCGTTQEVGFSVDSWELPELAAGMTTEIAALNGCERVSFAPQATLKPTNSAAGSASGVDFALHVPQEGLTTPDGLSSATLKDAAVTLPQGIVLNPSSASGLTGCSEEEIGIQSSSPTVFSAAAPTCPASSKIGTVTVTTPLLPEPLGGSLYVATQYANPLHTLVGGYLVIEGQGVLVKLAGRFSLNPTTGQITGSFEENPQVPFSEMQLHFNGGERGVIINPSECGQYATQTDLTPWSAPESPVDLSSTMVIATGCGTGGFAPSFTAGAESDQAGAFSPLVTSFARIDSESQFSALRFTLPAGASAKLAGVPLCSDASAGSCPEGSRIGSVDAGAGAGSPIFISGSVYLTGPYNGGPFGVAVVVPANAGPFHLGNVVVRGSIRIDPHTGQATIVSDPFPQFIGETGIPTDVRRVDIDIDRPGFTLNPTNCNEMSVTGTLSSVTGQQANVSQRFQAAGCASLAFKPQFATSTSGKTSKADGASLHVRLVAPHEGPGSGPSGAGEEANIARVKVELPKALPSRLTTLQKACTAAQFDANPAGCPAASNVGTAIASTPILNNPLTGPAYFVSHGNEAFPQLIVVLQGEGITVDLAGNTFISKAGITSSTFESVPDVPVSSFELTLPQGKYSALAANANLCAQKLVMPTELVAQNGVVIHQNTPMGVEGCSTSLSFAHSIKKKTLTLHVYAPAAGKITAGGKGLTAKTKTAKNHEDLTIILKQKKAGKLKTTIKVTYTPATGKDRKKQTKTAKLRFKK